MLPLSFFGQVKDSIYVSNQAYLTEFNDTLSIRLDEVELLSKHKFQSPDDIRYYLWFRNKVRKAYPYATLAAQRLDTLSVRLDKIKSRSGKRHYTRLIQRYLEGEFTDQLKKLTRTEGRILIKLIDRQTGKTVFDQIKDFRSGWKAFWYNITANVFSLSLKTGYHPESENEDFLIEEILRRDFLKDILIEQKSKLDFDFYQIYRSRGGKIDVSVYKLMFAKAGK